MLELLIVISILGILIAIAIPAIKGMKDQGNIAKAKSDVQTIKAALESYYMFGSPRTYPPTSTTVQATYLATASPNLLGDVIYDPFAPTNTEYNYICSSNGKYYVIWSLGTTGV